MLLVSFISQANWELYHCQVISVKKISILFFFFKFRFFSTHPTSILNVYFESSQFEMICEFLHRLCCVFSIYLIWHNFVPSTVRCGKKIGFIWTIKCTFAMSLCWSQTISEKRLMALKCTWCFVVQNVWNITSTESGHRICNARLRFTSTPI